MVANYFSSVLGETLQSAPVTFTVQPLTPTISCSSIDVNALTAANATTLFHDHPMQHGPYIDWVDATYSITFIGAQTFTDSNLTVDSSLTFETAAKGTVKRHRCQAAIDTNVPLMEPTISVRRKLL